MDKSPSAFPVVVEGGEFSGLHAELSYGMSLRDYLAAAAVQSVSCGILAEQYIDSGSAAIGLAIAAYEIADAMLGAREAKGGESK